MGVNGGYLYPPTIARFGGKKKSFYIGSNAIYFIQGKPLDGCSYCYHRNVVVPIVKETRTLEHYSRDSGDGDDHFIWNDDRTCQLNAQGCYYDGDSCSCKDKGPKS